MSDNTFVLFSNLHLLTLLIVTLVCVFIPLKMKNATQRSTENMSKIIAYVILAHVVTSPFKDLFYLENPYDWREVLPFHMCDLSEIFVAWFLLGGPKICYKIAFFWGMAGATLAMITPDIQKFDIEYVYFYIGHGMIVLGILYAAITLGNRPFFKDVGLVSLITLFALLPAIWTINTALGDPANYWYLAQKPSGESLFDLFPDPPFHLLITTPIALIMFYLLYIPFFFIDKSKK